jgi:hypothetical protein
VEHERSLGHHHAVIDAILHYLINNPDAKDTTEGVRRWWLPEGQRDQPQEQLEKILDSLVSKNWLTMRMTSKQTKIYGLNKDSLKSIKDYLNDSDDQA